MGNRRRAKESRRSLHRPNYPADEFTSWTLVRLRSLAVGTSTDDGGLSYTQPITINVFTGSLLPPTITGPAQAVLGQPVTFTFSAAGPGPFDFSINWGDGSPAQIISGPSGTTGVHTSNSARTRSAASAVCRGYPIPRRTTVAHRLQISAWQSRQ